MNTLSTLITGQIQVLTIQVLHFLGQDWPLATRMKIFSSSSNVLFHLILQVVTHDCVIHEREKSDKSQKFNAKRVNISPFKILSRNSEEVYGITGKYHDE